MCVTIFACVGNGIGTATACTTTLEEKAVTILVVDRNRIVQIRAVAIILNKFTGKKKSENQNESASRPATTCGVQWK
jgi:hypothetical protein